MVCRVLTSVISFDVYKKNLKLTKKREEESNTATIQKLQEEAESNTAIIPNLQEEEEPLKLTDDRSQPSRSITPLRLDSATKDQDSRSHSCR
jgi:hypothetical protein